MRCAFCPYVLVLGVCAVDKYASPESYLCSFSSHYLPGQLNYISGVTFEDKETDRP